MDIVLTLVVNPDQHHILEAATKDMLSKLGQHSDRASTLSEKRAVDIQIKGISIKTAISLYAASLCAVEGLDWCMQHDGNNRRKKMLIADMDSTMITVECIDELADFVGLKEKVSQITEAAMRGELDFEAALRERVALLQGLKTTDLHQCYEERIKLMSGAETLVQTMQHNGAYAALVSGGFTYFTQRIANSVGFNSNRANTLEIHDDTLTGKVIEPICGAETKLEALHEYCANLNIKPSDVLAVGDGANDIPMINAAGLGVAYHAKPKTAAAAQAAVNCGDLTTLLFFQGYREEEFIR